MVDSKEVRGEFDYREKYIKHNQGFLGIYICAHCLRPVMQEDMEVDHIVPLSKGGPNALINCVATCRKCNRKKSDKIDIKTTVIEVIVKTVEEIILLAIKIIKSILKMIVGNISFEYSGKSLVRLSLIVIAIYVICFS